MALCAQGDVSTSPTPYAQAVTYAQRSDSADLSSCKVVLPGGLGFVLASCDVCGVAVDGPTVSPSVNEQNECLMRIRKSLNDIEHEAACLDTQEAMALDRVIMDGRAVIRQARKRMREEQEAQAQAQGQK